MKLPFQYGKLAEGFSFVNRIKEKQTLKINLSTGINTMLISPRRLGKSSLVKVSMAELEKENPTIKVCFIDAFTIKSEDEFYQVFVREVIKAVSNKWETWISTAKKFLAALSPKISIGVDPMTDFSVGLEWNSIKENELTLLNLPEKIAQAKKIKIVICIDEFQNLAKLKDYNSLEQKMRSVWQHQQNVTYCLYGSKRHMMIDIFNSPSKPFYRFGQIMFLSKIAEKEWVNFIVNAFETTGKSISETLTLELVQMVDSHSWYVQQLAYFVWNLTENKVDAEILQQAIEQVIDANLPLYQNECDALTASQLNLLIAVAGNEQFLTAVETLNKYNMGTPQNVSKNKKVLQNRDIIEKTKDGFLFLDPVFRRWFVREYVR
ncbi:MAG: ATP-binding protein [Dysgonamonadaceae bacterium]|jgi:AAA+ ATPase superfamily predicted ATPase|nr:ATP-binding protein [Dysgonamonadaceae bacterium]